MFVLATCFHLYLGNILGTVLCMKQTKHTCSHFQQRWTCLLGEDNARLSSPKAEGRNAALKIWMGKTRSKLPALWQLAASTAGPESCSLLQSCGHQYRHFLSPNGQLGCSITTVHAFQSSHSVAFCPCELKHCGTKDKMGTSLQRKCC